jgi:hypothetical protein
LIHDRRSGETEENEGRMGEDKELDSGDVGSSEKHGRGM